MIAATAAVIVAVSGWLHLGFGRGTADHVIATGANETATKRLSNGIKLALGANSSVRIAAAKNSALRVEGGEVIIDVPHDLERSQRVETFLMNATADAGTTFRVSVDSSVEFEVYEGALKVSNPDAAATGHGPTLRKGKVLRVRANWNAGVLDGHRGRVTAGSVDTPFASRPRSIRMCFAV